VTVESYVISPTVAVISAQKDLVVVKDRGLVPIAVTSGAFIIGDMFSEEYPPRM
jgi:hypothetical protein